MRRVVLLVILAFEGLGGIFGGSLLIAAPDGHLMDMPVTLMHGTFPDFLIPGIILTGMGILASIACVVVFFKSRLDWVLAYTALIGFTIWFAVEIAILRELHWLQIVWGIPVLLGLWTAIPLLPNKHHED